MSSFVFFSRGATSEVFKVTQKGTENKYAMKKIRKNVRNYNFGKFR